MQTITIQNSELKSLLSGALFSVPKRGSLAQLENVVLCLNGKLTARGTDLDKATLMTLPYHKNQTSGIHKALLSKRAARDIVKSISTGKDDVTEITFEDTRLKIGKRVYSFNPEQLDVPDISKSMGKELVSFEMASEDFQAIYKKICYAVSSDEFRVALMGVLMQYEPKENEIAVVATDGHRLATLKIPFTEGKISKQGFAYIVKPEVFFFASKYLSLTEDLKVQFFGTEEIKIFEDVKCKECGHVKEKARTETVTNVVFIRISDGTTEIISRLIDEQFPNWEAVIPRENEKLLTIHRKEFISVLKEAIQVANKDTSQVRLQISQSECKILSDNLEDGNSFESEVRCKYHHDELLIGFNGKFLLSVLQSIESELVQAAFSTPTRAAIFTAIDSPDEYEQSLLTIAMPVRLNA